MRGGHMRVNGHVLPGPNDNWAPFFEEFFFHTSRYFPTCLSELQKIAGMKSSMLYDFNAGELSDAQRFVLSWMMTSQLDRPHAEEVLKVLEKFHQLDRKNH